MIVYTLICQFVTIITIEIYPNSTNILVVMEPCSHWAQQALLKLLLIKLDMGFIK